MNFIPLDGGNENARIFAVPPRYGTRQMLRNIAQSKTNKALPEFSPSKFLEGLYGQKRSLGRIETALERLRWLFEEGPFADGCAHFQVRPTAKKDSLRVSVSFMISDNVECLAGERKGLHSETVIVRLLKFILGPEKAEMISVPGKLAITRHAIERFCEREHCHQANILARFSEEIEQAHRYMAFAFTAGINVGGDHYSPTTETAVPFGDGLLFVRNQTIAIANRTNPAARCVFKKGKSYKKWIEMPPEQVAALPESLPSYYLGFIMPVGMTYVPYGMLRSIQKDYLESFVEIAAEADLEALLHESFEDVYCHISRDENHGLVAALPDCSELTEKLMAFAQPGLPEIWLHRG